MLISHLPNVQKVMGITIMPRPAVYEYPRATAATVHHQAIIQVGVACICCIYISDPRQVPFEEQGTVKVKIILPLLEFTITQTLRTTAKSSPVKVVFFTDPAAMALSSDQQQVEQSYEAEQQASEEQLSEGRYEEPRKHLG